MSKVATHLQQTLHSPNRQLKQQPRDRASSCSQRFNGKIVSTRESEDKHTITKKKINYLPQLLKQTTAAAIEANTKKEIIANNFQSQKITVKVLEDTYWIEQASSPTKDFKIYQNGKVNEFFQNECPKTPNTFADICLVNDHYILVKMPDQEPMSANEIILAEAAARRKDFRELKQHNANILKTEERENDKRKLCRYLRHKRHRITKIAPIHEEPEDLIENEKNTHPKSNCLKMQSCWQANEQEVESYRTQTKMHKNMTNSTSDYRPQTVKRSSSSKAANEKSQCIAIPKTREIQTVSGSLLKSSANDHVSLQKYGSLVESENSNNSINSSETLNTSRHKKCPHLEGLYCLFRPFRGKYRKSKPKVQAVVYKTYFVKWTKPPDTLCHGYGIQTIKSSEIEMSVFRRCRSATF